MATQETPPSKRIKRATTVTFVVTVVLLLGATNLVGLSGRLKLVAELTTLADINEEEILAIKSLRRPSIVLFGDSLTQRSFGEDSTNNVGWASLLAAAYARRADVKNRGFGGHNTHHALHHVWPDIVEEAYHHQEVLFGTLFWGANDAVLPGNGTNDINNQHVPLEEYRDNLLQLIANIQKLQPTMPLFLFTPPPVNEKVVGEGPNRRSNQVTKRYGEVAQEIAAQKQLPLLDTWQLLEGNNQTALMQYLLTDGLHLNEQGNRKIYQGLMDLLHRESPHIAPKTFRLKNWREYD